MFGMNPMGGVNQGGMAPPMGQMPQQRPPMGQPPMAQPAPQPQPMQNPQMMQQLAQAQALRGGAGMPAHGISGAPLQGGRFA